MRSKTRFSGTARLIRSAGVLTMLLIAADGFARGDIAARAPCGGQLLHCAGCSGQGEYCSYYSGGQWCNGTSACIDCEYNPHIEGLLCLAVS
jgi:hypothetical protein